MLRTQTGRGWTQGRLPALDAPDCPVPPVRIADPLPARGSPERREIRRPIRRTVRVQLTERDLAILRDLTRFWAMTVDQVARRHFGAVNTAANRLAQLVAAGHVRVERLGFHGRASYLTTPSGARLADVGLPAARYSPTAVCHRLAVVDLANRLLAEHPDAAWVTERELRRDGMMTVRDRRRGQLLTGTPHAPDGVLVLPGQWPVAVELELSGKRDAEYVRILRWYGAALDYRSVRWFCATDALRQRLARLVSEERMDDLVSVEPVPGCSA